MLPISIINKKLVIPFVAILELVFIVLVDAFYLNILISGSSITISTIYLLFLGLILFSLALLILYIKLQRYISIYSRIVLILWISLSLWFWGFGSIYFFSVINLNALQLKWAGFSFLWEVPILGILFVTICITLFRRIYIKVQRDNVERTYRQLLRYPLYVGILLFLFTVAGYVIGAIELRVFANLPYIEFWKNVANGVVISIFLSFFDYLIIDYSLSDIRKKLKKDFNFKTNYPRKLAHRVLTMTCIISLATVGVIYLFVFQLAQIMIGQSVYNQLLKGMDNGILLKDPSAVMQILKISNDTLLISLTDKSLLNRQGLSPETIKSISNSSFLVTADENYTQKLVSVAYYPALGQRVVCIVPLNGFYLPLLLIPVSLLILGVFLTLFILVVAITFTDLLSKKIKLLTNSIKKAVVDNVVPDLDINTEDELEELSNSFTYFVKEIKSAVQESRLEESKFEQEAAKLETLIQDLPVGVEVLDPTSGNVAIINKAGLELLGSEVSGNVLREKYLMVKEDGSVYTDEENPIIKSLKEDKMVSSSNLFLKKETGEIIALKIICSPVKDKNGKTVSNIVLLIDVNKEYQLDKIKTQFIYFTSHELRTPMTAIKGIVSMVLSSDYGNISEEIRSAMQDILRSINSLLQIVNDTLSLSRIQTGVVKVNATEFPLSMVIKEVIDDFTSQAEEKGIKLEFEARDEIKINSDKEKVKEIMNNLISNGIKYTNKGHVKVSYETKSNKVVISVEDTGMGIDQKDQEKLFKAFTNLEKNEYSGTYGNGIGLYISKQLALILGGELSLADSTLQKGSTFTLELPLR